MSDIDALQQQAAERWRDKQLARQATPSTQARIERENELDASPAAQQELQKRRQLEHPGPEDELQL